MKANLLSQKYLDKIRKRCQAATPGPWTSQDGKETCAIGGELFILRAGETPGLEHALSFATPADLEFIAHARDDIPLLLEEISKLRKLLAKAKS